MFCRNIHSLFKSTYRQSYHKRGKVFSKVNQLFWSHLFNFVCLLVSLFFFLMLPFVFTSQWLKEKNVLPSEHGNTYYAVGFKRLRKNDIFSQRQE